MAGHILHHPPAVPALRLRIGDSRLLRGAAAAAIAASSGSILLLPLPWAGRCLLLAVTLWFALRSGTLRAAAPHELLYDGQRRWLLDTGAGGWQSLTLQTPALVLPWCVVLRFRTEAGARRGFVLLPDNVAPAALRRLRVRLLLRR